MLFYGILQAIIILMFHTRTSTLLAKLSLVLFVISLSQTALYIDAPGDNAESSLLLLLAGWLGMLIGWVPAFCWLANILYALSVLYYFKRNRTALLTSIASLPLAAAFLKTSQLIVSESPTYAVITGYGAGFWLWLGSMLVLTIAIAAGMVRRNDSQSSVK